MAELEKVIKGLECCVGSKKVDECGWEDGDYKECPYNGNANGCVFRLMKDALSLLKARESDESKYEYHTDHTDCPWYISGEESKCPVTCSQYRDGWNDAMNYIFRNGDGYRPYDRMRKGGEVEWIGKPQSSGLKR